MEWAKHHLPFHGTEMGTERQTSVPGTTKGLELSYWDMRSWCLWHWRMTMRMDGRKELAQTGSPSVKPVDSPNAICRVYYENPVTAQRTGAALISYPAKGCQSWLFHHWEQQSRGTRDPLAWAAALCFSLHFYNSSGAPVCRWGQDSNWVTRTVCSVCCASLLGTLSPGRK